MTARHERASIGSTKTGGGGWGDKQTEGFVLKAANKGKKTKPASLDLLKDFFKAKKLGRASRICNGFSPKERVIIGLLFKT